MDRTLIRTAVNDDRIVVLRDYRKVDWVRLQSRPYTNYPYVNEFTLQNKKWCHKRKKVSGKLVNNRQYKITAKTANQGYIHLLPLKKAAQS